MPDVMRDLERLLATQDFQSVEQLNAFLDENVRGRMMPRTKPANDRERAEDIVRAAQEERSVALMRKRVAEALALDPDCIAAHLLLAEIAENPIEALGHCRAAIASGERVLADVLSDTTVSPWLHIRARPYMQARAYHAELLWRMGDRRAAIAESQSILALNPNDNQGIRYLLLAWLMQAGSIAETEALLEKHRERSAAWLFSTALHLYRSRGLGDEGTRALGEAIEANPYVAPMLLGEMEASTEEPMSYSYGGEDEALLYVHASGPAWWENSGAMEWLAATNEAVSRSQPRSRKRRRRR